MNAVVKVSAAPSLMPANMDQAMRLAEMMSTAKLVPVHLQGKPGDCLLVIEQAMRWGMSPFAVAQATSVISQKLMFEGKLVSAALNASGLLSSRMTYDYEGEGDKRAITATATIRGETKPRSIRCTLAEAKTTNGMWTKQPDQQLAYFATRAWARRHAPEVMLGVYSPEEFDTPPETFRGPTIDAETASNGAAKRDTPQPPSISDQPKRTYRQLLDETGGMLAACDNLDAVVAVAELPAVLALLKSGNETVKREMNALLAQAFAKHRTDPDPGLAEKLAEGDDFPGDRP